MKGHIRLL